MKALSLVLAVLLWSTMAAQAAGTVPFQVTISTSVAQVGSCGPSCVVLDITGSGVGSHLGRVDIEGPSEIDFTTLQQTGTSTLTGADGSTIDISFAGVFVPTGPTDATFQGAWTITGGTGRFEDATGGGTYDGSAAGDTGLLNLSGTLSNPGRKP
jgi:hypothetical protein